MGFFHGCFLSHHFFKLFLNEALSLSTTVDDAEIGGKFIDELTHAVTSKKSTAKSIYSKLTLMS